jgi:actin related protein 2/3 complex subunit 4
MSSSLAAYVEQVRSHLNESMTALVEPPSSTKSTSTKYPIRPHVELPGTGQVTEHTISRKNKEKCFIESSKNSVRVSFLFKQQSSSDPIDQSILCKYMRFFQQRAELYTILRRKPISGYSVSFLVLNTSCTQFGRDTILQVIIDFLSQIDRECSDVKIAINARARLVASEFMMEF